MIVGAIDYSMTSPGITVYNTESGRFVCHFLSHTKKCIGSFHHKQFIGSEYPEWACPEDRFEKLSTWAMDIVKNCDHVFLEGYAFAGKGQVFQIAENTGLLKHNLYRQSIPFDVFAPASIKKHATGSGRAKKSELYDAFVDKTGIDLCAVLDISKKDGNPVSDIIDSFWICDLGLTTL